MSAVETEKLMQDMKAVAKDAEVLLKATAGEVGEKAKEARVRLGEALEAVKLRCENLQEQAVAKAKVADQVIREHPYQSIGVAFGVGVLLGVLLTRK